MDNLSGGTTNLLRMARSECRAAAAFVALALDDDMFATATYRAVPDDELFRSEAVDDLIRQAWADPEFGHGGALLRVARLGGRRLSAPKRTALAIVPLIDGPGGRPWGLLGVAGPDSGSFDNAQIELLGRIAHRLSSYFRARQAVRQQMGAPESVTAPPGPAPSRQPVSSVPSQPATAPAQAAPGGAEQGAMASSPQAFAAQPQAAPATATTGAEAPRIEEPGWTVSPPPAPAAPSGPSGVPAAEATAGGAMAAGPTGAQAPTGAPIPPATGAPTPPQAPTPAQPPSGEWTAVLEPLSSGEATAPELHWGRPGEPTPSIRWGQPPRVPRHDAAEEGAAARRPPWTDEPGWDTAPKWEVSSDWEQQGVAQDEELWWEAGIDLAQPPTGARTVAGEPQPPAQPGAAPAQARAPEPPSAPRAQPRPAPPRGDALGEILRGEDSVTGLLPLGALLGRTGRMLGAAMAGGGALAMVVLELAPEDRIGDDQLRGVARALRSELRFDDPVARIGPRAFAAVVPLVPGGSGGPGLEEHLVRTVQSTLDADIEVRAAHALASLDERHDADELLRAAISQLRAE